MKVKMRTNYAGPKGSCRPGHIIDLPEKEARQIVDGNYGWYVVSAIEVTSASDTAKKTIPIEQSKPVHNETKRKPGRPRKDG